MVRRLLICAAAFVLCGGAAFARVTVNSKTSIFIDAREPGPIQLAAKDLASDLQKVFGHPVRIVHEPSAASPVTLWIAFNHDLPKSVTRPAGWEQFRIQAVVNPWPGSPVRQGIVLTGSGVRGTIYAIYQFSQQFLGVDPLYWWTDHPPARRQAVAVPDGYSETQGPVFRHRGFFINDEDLLTGWRSGIPDGADISLKTWNRIFEAILRLKGDMVIPGTWIFPYEPQIKAAEERGLIVTQHHVNVLGLDTYRWPEDKPYSFINAPAIFEAALKRSVEEYPQGAEIIWSVGYRGHNDYPFWLADKNAPKTAAGRAKVIQDAIGKEIEIVSEAHPHPEIVLNAWAEAAPFIRQGLLKVPAGVTLVWPDDGHGTIQDRGEIKAGEGEYYHTAMIDWRSNHFSELVPLERIRRELGRAARAGATDYL
ncbi:MAG: glycosyl hydrolase 115 family protein, partial [Acidobacteriota bacterium]|nr:glycosyl hydrolase 115 family protein [Acidobacteriota bacterium]